MPNYYAIDELVTLTGISKRTIRYYVQIELIDKPEGETRAAKYGQKQLEQLLMIQKWSRAGMSLEAIRRLLHDEPGFRIKPELSIGQSSVKTHVHLGSGVEVVIDPSFLSLTHDELRNLVSRVTQVVQSLSEKK